MEAIEDFMIRTDLINNYAFKVTIYAGVLLR